MRSLATIPRTSGPPIIGNLKAFRSERIALQRRIFDECGDIGVFRIGPVPMVMVTGAEYAHAILVEQHEAFQKSPGLRTYARPLLGNGLLTSDADDHKRQRKLVSPAFHHKRLSAYAAVIGEFAARTTRAWTHGQRLDVHHEMMRLTLAIVGRTLFDADVVDDAEEVGASLEIAMRRTMEDVGSVLHLPKSWPTPGNLRLRRAITKLDRIVYRIIRERRESGKDAGDVLSMLLLARDDGDGSGLSDLEVRDQVMTLFLAGHETTANALSWSWHLLSHHREIYDQLIAEAQASLRGGLAPTLDDLPRLPYALKVLKESMRLYPPAYLVGRQAIRDVALGPHTIPKGTIVMVNIYMMHRRPDVFPNPERFDPNRFDEEAERRIPRSAYLPFGAGPRICIGNHFALMEGQLVLSALAQQVRFHSGLEEIAPDPLLTLRPRGGMPMTVARLD